jgi:uncharacterized protein YecT (DUF1311 family)
MKNLNAFKVVAFTKTDPDVAITCNPADWKPTLDFSTMTLHLRNKKESRTYNLATDALCAYPISGRQESDIGKTAGRMLLTGIATGALSKGKGGGGALMDLALRGSEKRVIAGVCIVMHDTTAVTFESTVDEFTSIVSKLHKAVPNLGDESDHTKIIKTIDSLAADGERVLIELDESISSASQRYLDAQKNAETGATFAERNNQRNLIQELSLNLRRKEGIRDAVKFRFAWLKRPPEKIKIKTVLTYLWGLFVLVVIVAGIKNCMSEPEAINAKSRNKQSPASTSQKREDMQTPKTSVQTNSENNSGNINTANDNEQPVKQNQTAPAALDSNETLNTANIQQPKVASTLITPSTYQVCNLDGNGEKFLALKEGASASSTRVTKMPEGTALTVLDKKGEWYQVKMPNGSVGWAHSKWLCETNGQSSATEKTPSTIASRPSKSPSFNCQNASTRIEKMICSSDELAELDVQLSVAYKNAQLVNSDKELLKKQQDNWRKNNRDACSTEPCVKSAYRSRTAELK